MSQSFITYSTKDSSFTDKISADLEEKTDLNIIIDRQSISGGDSLIHLLGQIEASDFQIAVITKNSINSNWCKKELEVGINKEIDQPTFHLIPIVGPNQNFEELLSEMSNDLRGGLRHKHFIHFENQPYEQAFKELVKALTPKETSEYLYAEVREENGQNPFWRVRAEHFTKPSTFVHVFEDPEKTYKQMMSGKPTLIVGSRGSGKTMLLRSVKASLIPSIKNAKSFSNQDIPYFGVFLRSTRGTFSLIDYEIISKVEAKAIFYDHIILSLGQSILIELMYCKKNNIPKIDDDIEEKICKAVLNSLRITSNSNNFVDTENMVQNQIDKINDYVRNKIRGTSTEYDANALSNENLDRLCRAIKNIIPELQDSYFCFLIDEYENLTHEQKIVINTLIKLHNAESYTFKVASKKTGFDTMDTLEDQPLEEGHDYDLADMDFDIEKIDEKARYGKHLLKICQKIMKEEGFEQCNIKEILEDRVKYFNKNNKTVDGLTRTKILDEIKKTFSPRKTSWDELEDKQISTLFSRFGSPAEYRLLKPKTKSFAGFDDFVTFSSGNVRVFLELCGMSYIFALRDKKMPKKGDKISVKNQNQAISTLSEYYAGSLRRIPEIGKVIQKFVNDLGAIFREKLLNHNSEPESARLSISNPEKLTSRVQLIEGKEEMSLEEIFDICIRFSVFHEYGSGFGRRGKTGYATTSEDYILNRIFSQTLKISPRPMHSLSVTCEEIANLFNPNLQKTAKKNLMDKVRKSSRASSQIESLTDYFDKK